jgi:hypothetical protein
MGDEYGYHGQPTIGHTTRLRMDDDDDGG